MRAGDARRGDEGLLAAPLGLDPRAFRAHPPSMTVSDRERLHFARIAEAKRAEHDLRALEAAAEPAMKRIIEGLELGYAAPTDALVEALLDARALGQVQFYERARQLGLYRPGPKRSGETP